MMVDRQGSAIAQASLPKEMRQKKDSDTLVEVIKKFVFPFPLAAVLHCDRRSFITSLNKVQLGPCDKSSPYPMPLLK